VRLSKSARVLYRYHPLFGNELEAFGDVAEVSHGEAGMTRSQVEALLTPVPTFRAPDGLEVETLTFGTLDKDGVALTVVYDLGIMKGRLFKNGFVRNELS
jgi:hypothetical protein